MSSDFPFGYCTNVHAGVSLADAQRNLLQIAAPIQRMLQPQGRLPVGLWLAEHAARELDNQPAVSRLREFLDQHQFKAYTFNGFPQGDFHQPVVKHAVYQPTWCEPSRLEYTRQLARVLCGLLDPGQTGSISTLPLGWPGQPWSSDQFHRAGQQLKVLATDLHRLMEDTGHEITLAIEPEPGCVLDTAVDMIEFLRQYVFDDDREIARRHITVCHDICHSAVMHESQVEVLSAYQREHIRIGKVQVSSAMIVPWSRTANDEAQQHAIAEQLRKVSEPRYLHQTTRRQSDGSLALVEDLPQALADWLRDGHPVVGSDSQESLLNDWRIHFHVPIYTKHFGQLAATRDDISEAVDYIESQREASVDNCPWFTGDYEVETYAWGVLPAELQEPDLAHGIARELQYLESLLKD